MVKDESLRRDVLDVLVRADNYNWIHQTTWFGEPILQLPQDMFALQEIIYQTRAEYIIELGVAWGGSLLFYSTLMEVLGGKRIIGVDVYIPEDLKQRLNGYGNLSKRITLVAGSTLDNSILEQVKSIVGQSKRIIVHLDSNHTHEHVLQELKLYSRFVGKGYYIVCGDTIVEDMPKPAERPWGSGNSPKTARDAFLRENDRFEVDERLENKLLFTCNPGGYLKAIKE